MKNILITGGAGFIGSHTCLFLLSKGYQLFVIDSFINSSRHSLIKLQSKFEKEKLFIFEGDLKDINFVKRVFNEARNIGLEINSVIHFAGLKSVKESVNKPLDYWENNVYGTLNLLKVMEENQCETIVFSSSASIYNADYKHLLDENCHLNPLNPYAKTKYVIEKMLFDVSSSNSKWRIINLRYFNPIGADPSGLIGEEPRGIPNNLFPYINKVAIGKIKSLKIFGNDWPTKDGTGVRDYIHVMDLAEGHYLALDYLLKNKIQFTNLNIGSGVGTSVLELVKTFQKVNDIKIPYTFSSRRKADYAIVIADNNLAKSILNWTPKRNLEEMCRDGWNWQKNNPNGYSEN